MSSKVTLTAPSGDEAVVGSSAPAGITAESNAAATTAATGFPLPMEHLTAFSRDTLSEPGGRA